MKRRVVRGLGVIAAVSALGLLLGVTPSPAVVAPDGYLRSWADAPYVAAVYAEVLDFSGYPAAAGVICTGVVVAPRAVVTAAHCLDDDFVNYRVLVKNSSRDRGKVVQVKHFYRHQRYSGFTAQNDIAVLILEQPAGVPAVKLPPAGSTLLDSFRTFDVLGWGEDQNGDLPEQIAVAQLDNMTQDGQKYFLEFNPKTMIAAGAYREDERLYSGVCSGDSGGPLIAHFGKNTFLVGVTSFGDKGGCNTETPSVFTRVSYYKDWLDPILKLKEAR